jgi:methionyl-tRNA formyltransferase
VNLIIAATNAVAIPTIESLREEHSLTIVTMPDSPVGRGKVLTPSAIAIKYPEAQKPNSEPELAEILGGKDLLITIGYGRILKETTLNIPKFGGINLHFSLLPKWRGAAPVQRAIEAGDKRTGVTVFQMDRGMDTGPIWSQIEFNIPELATSVSLFDELSKIGVDAVNQSIMKIAKGEKPMAQTGEATYAGKISKQECIIDWNDSAQVIERKVRAFADNPGVTSKIRDGILKIEEVSVAEESLRPAEINVNGLVGTSTQAIQLIKVTPAGKKTMLVRDWLNGFKVQPGERFE